MIKHVTRPAVRAASPNPNPEPPATTPTKEETVLLELAKYKVYTRQGVRYEAGKAYRFRLKDALVLMKEEDGYGNNVWKQTKAEATKPKAKIERAATPIVDATTHTVEETPEEDEPRGMKPIEIGDESELADLNLNGEDDEEAEDEGDIETV